MYDEMIDDIFKQSKKRGQKPFEYNPDKFDPINIEDYGFDKSKTVVHGTNLEKAININKERELTGGTFLYPGRGGIQDARNWAKNVYNNDAVVIFAETDKDNVRGEGFLSDTNWVTLGERAEERKYRDVTYDKLGIKKMLIAKVNKDGDLEEIFKW